MPNSIDIKLDQNIKGTQCIISQMGFPQNSILQINQSNNKIFCSYHPSPEAPKNRCNLSARLCELNNIRQGPASISVVTGAITKCKRVEVIVSALDWQIINNYSEKLQSEFLNQINIIWPHALLPLYYDKNNCIKLEIKCEQLSYLGENTELEILTREDSQMKPQAKQNKESKHKFTNLQIRKNNQFGNINRVQISNKILSQKFNAGENSRFYLKYYSYPQDHIPSHTSTLSIKEQLSIIKQNLSVENTRKQEWVPVNVEWSQEYETQTLYVDEMLEQISCINSRNDSSELVAKKEQIIPKKLTFLLSSMKDFRIIINVFNKQDDSQFYEQIKTKFSEQMLNFLENSSKTITIYQNIPFLIGNYPVYLSLFEGKQLLPDPISIYHEQPFNSSITLQLSSSIQLHNLYYRSHVPVFKKENLIKLNKMISFPKNMDITFRRLYRINYEKQIKRLLQLLSDTSNNFILISSFSNNGKTILHQILDENGIKALYINMYEMKDVSLTSGDVNIFLQSCFQRGSQKIIFLDNLDAVCAKIDAGDLHRRQQRIAAKMIIRKIKNLTKLYTKKCILTAKNQDSVDEQLKLYELIKLKNPHLSDRIRVLEKYHNHKSQENEEIAKESESMSFGQFYKFAINKIKCDVQTDQTSVKNNFDRLAGLKYAKKHIGSLIKKPLRYNFVFKNLPVKLSRGILLYGGSGTGKTALGEALADQFKMKFFSVKGSDILSKYIGGSEAAVREIFEKAMSVSPSIVFFDEFETIVPRRNSSNTGVTDRVVNQFLCYLDGVASIQGVFIVAASSRPDLIDPALLRPGRLDSHLFLEYPKIEERTQLFMLYRNSITFEVGLQRISEMTEGYSYSDIVGLIKELRIKRSSEVLNRGQATSQQQFKYISEKLLEDVLKYFKISVSKSDQEYQNKAFIKFKTGAPPDISKQKTILQ